MPQRSIHATRALYASPAPWSIEVERGWTVKERERVESVGGERREYAEIAPESGGSLLHLSITSPTHGRMSAEEWVNAVGRVHRPMGRAVVPVRFGVFTGFAVAFAAGERWLRSWVLRAGTLPLEVGYECSLDAAGRDDPVVDGMLGTLYLRGLPP